MRCFGSHRSEWAAIGHLSRRDWDSKGAGPGGFCRLVGLRFPPPMFVALSCRVFICQGMAARAMKRGRGRTASPKHELNLPGLDQAKSPVLRGLLSLSRARLTEDERPSSGSHGTRLNPVC